jgi:hypothetical protein
MLLLELIFSKVLGLKKSSFSRFSEHNLMSKIMEPTTGIEPVNLFLTKEALYRLSYVGAPV